MDSIRTVSNQYVPVVISLSDDAPGYRDPAECSSSSSGSTIGPLCWKCDGTGTKFVKTRSVMCKVCGGCKRLPVKKSVLTQLHSKLEDDLQTVKSQADSSDVLLGTGEQLCGLVGDWRIIQHYGGHRWTTDDIVTAWVAVQASQTIIPPINQALNSGGNRISFYETDESNSTIMDHNRGIANYLDLGCGNGSVLLMTSKHLPDTTRCTGIEARGEAVGLAKKSIIFNCGLQCERITVRNMDFREIYLTAADDTVQQSRVLPEGPVFDLITGTPPYFRVNFEVDSTSQIVQQALIRQGGMPTCKESAPARCEFRGGIEAYCKAAYTALSDRGVFVVCENYLNHDRAMRAAKETGMHICSVQRVIGKEGKGPLFCVYTMIRQSLEESLRRILLTQDTPISDNSHHQALVDFLSSKCLYKPDLIVRDNDGAWTLPYADMLKQMKYPVTSLHPSGRY